MSAGIEAARFVLALSVVLFHWNGSLPNGYLAVDLFFIISGFVIGQRYEAALRAGASTVDFAISRVIRLYPLYLVSIAAGLLSASLEPLVTADWSYSLSGLSWRALFLLPVLDTSARPLGIQSFPLNTPVWSLWCEVLASLVFLLLCRLPRWAMALPVLFGVAILVATACRSSTFSAGGDGLTVMVGLGRIGFSFFAGVLLTRLPPLPCLTGWPAGLSLATLLGMVLIYFRLTETRTDTMVSVLIALVGVFPLLTLCVSYCQLRGRLARFCLAGGSLSYAIYILHWPIFRIIRWLTRTLAISEAQRSDFAITIAATMLLLAISYVATRYVDRPLRRYLNDLRRTPVLAQSS